MTSKVVEQADYSGHVGEDQQAPDNDERVLVDRVGGHLADYRYLVAVVRCRVAAYIVQVAHAEYGQNSVARCWLGASFEVEFLRGCTT